MCSVRPLDVHRVHARLARPAGVASRGRRPREGNSGHRGAVPGRGPLADFSVDDLAKGAGISRPIFYFYFRSKNAVLLSLLDQMNTKAHAALKSLRATLSGDPATLWRNRIEAFFEVSGSHRAVAVRCGGQVHQPRGPARVGDADAEMDHVHHHRDQGRT